MVKYICTKCYEVNKPINIIGGSTIIEIFLFLTVLFSSVILPLLIITLPVFLIYKHNRHRGDKKNCCPVCKTQTMVPVDSRRGEMLIAEQDRTSPQVKSEPVKSRPKPKKPQEQAKKNWLAIGKKRIEAKEYKEAVSALNNALKTDLNNKKTYYLRAFAYSKIADRQKALEDIKTAAKLGHPKAIEYLQKNAA